MKSLGELLIALGQLMMWAAVVVIFGVIAVVIVIH